MLLLFQQMKPTVISNTEVKHRFTILNVLLHSLRFYRPASMRRRGYDQLNARFRHEPWTAPSLQTKAINANDDNRRETTRFQTEKLN